MRSIYNEVSKFMDSNLHLIKYMSVEDKEALYNKSGKKLKVIIESIKNWTYRCEPIYIKKSNEGNLLFSHTTKLISLPSLNDIILQIAIKILIESECEKKIFNKQNFGFRPNRSVHHALNSVKKMKGVTWIIEGRVNKVFENIHYNILVNIIKKKLNPDRTLIGIFYKLLNAGYLVNACYDIYRDYVWRNVDKVFLGGIISPILLNLYLTPLDEFIDKLKENYALSPLKIYYVRFANEWVIGVEGDVQNHEELAKKIQDQIRTFLQDELKLELDKNKLIHLGRGYAKFLTHYLRWSIPSSLKSPSPSRGVNNVLLSSPKVIITPTILIPLKDLKSKLIEKGFADDTGYPKYVGKLLHLSDYDIVKNYNSLLTKIFVFYNMAANRSDLRELLYILEYSLAHTLAAKHRSTLSKIFKKYGKPIVVNVRGLGKIKFSRPDSLKAAYLNNKYKKFSV